MKRSLIVGISGTVALAALFGGFWAGLSSGIELAHGSHAAETGAVAERDAKIATVVERYAP
jgi:hypothetical protein